VSPQSKAQQIHYDRVANSYLTNLRYPHTQEYMAYLDREFLKLVTDRPLGTAAELCCGRGEAIDLLKDKMERCIGVDISMAMLEGAQAAHPEEKLLFLQGDATALPLADAAFDSVFMLGGIHHVPNREALFSEVARILKPGGRFYFREPVSDFVLWRAIRAVVYRLSPALDHATERPLLYSETAPFLDKAQLRLQHWRTCGFVGFCLFMNSDILIFNRLFRFIPGIRAITRFFAYVDNVCVSMPGFSRAGLQVIGVAEKPA
jgi:ubiquinone/menaquinone biosynthesis C-methylase UbiE